LDDLTGEACNKCFDLLQGEFLVLSVADDGCGINPEIQDRIFEPFFTTKEVGRGTGLGLSTVFGIVHQINGHVQVASSPGLGATFKILVPLLTPEGKTALPGVNGVQVLQGGTETILVVEDEALVRSLAATVLQQNGYTIHLANNGQAALQIFEKLEHRVDLVLTDIAMPGMDGIQLAKELQKKAPGTRILFMSGYLDEILESHSFDPSTMPLLKKPFGAGELIRRTKKMLDQGD